jgi:hypothetical protein
MIAFNSGNATVQNTGDITTLPTLPEPATGQTPVTIVCACDGNINTEYTVTAGKTLYIYAIVKSRQHSAAVYETDGSTLVWKSDSSSISDVTTSPVPIATYASGEFVKVSGGNSYYVFIYGIEV